MIVTPAMLVEIGTLKGGYSKRQIELGKKVTGESKGWLRGLIGREITEQQWSVLRKSPKSQQRKAAKVLNGVSVDKGGDWSWKPKGEDIPPIVVSANPKKAEKLKRKLEKRKYLAESKGFYESKEWLQLRVRVFEKYQAECMMCGRNRREHKVVLHVDHIKPRSKYPHLALEFNNLQILCADCNIGKGNRYETDWRPTVNNLDEMAEIEIAYEARQHL